MAPQIVGNPHIVKMENKMETTKVYCGNSGKMENKMETTEVYWGNIGKMENKMETTIQGLGCPQQWPSLEYRRRSALWSPLSR